MADMKTTKKKQSRSQPAPSSLKLDLHAPGMTQMHRAGLGGLAATLRAMERRHRRGELSEHALPPGPDLGGGYPWTIEPTRLTLDWGEPVRAGEYLRRLFAFGFGIKDKLIDLPGAYRREPSRAVRAELQQGLLLTFLQHGKTRTLGAPSVQYYDPDGEGLQQVSVPLRACTACRHQRGWEYLTKQGRLSKKHVRIEGPLAPGAVVRHNAFPTDTKVEDSPGGALALYFALVGCLSLPITRGAGVLLVPAVTDLQAFAEARPRMTPSTLRQCRIAGSGDAALQTMVRLRGKRLLGKHGGDGLVGLAAMRLAPTAWASQQKSRIEALQISSSPKKPDEHRRLRVFDIALRCLPRRVSATMREQSHEIGYGKDKSGKQKTIEVKFREQFWMDSVVRPLIADNLARNRPGYDGFVKLMRDRDKREKVSYEKKGLQAMIQEDELFEYSGEKNVIQAVHTALGRRYAEIADQYKGNQKAINKKWTSEYERWRMAFADAKTAERFRHAFCDLLSRAGYSRFLQEEWPSLLPMLDEKHWQQTRDLALLALPSYASKSKSTESEEVTEPETTEHRQ